jgi:hypothetical protein
MEKWKKRAVDLIASLAFGGRADPSVAPYYPQKTKISGPEKPFFARTTPERKGISSKRIYNMLCELERERRANIHTVMILKGGEVISECSVDCYDRFSWHVSNSMAKTVCGMVIGSLVDEGRIKIEERLVDIFPEVEYKDKKFPLITVEHLLTMTSGVDFAEAGAITSSEWTNDFFLAGVKFAPGTKFAYNSMNSYILARIAEKKTGVGFGELAKRRIFAPLGIENFLWEKGPEGTEKGGWGLYLSAESWAKLGFMMASGGSFFGKRILSSEWVKDSLSVKAIAPESSGNFNYAYQLWTARRGDDFLFNGMLGQNVWVCPVNDIIVIMLAGNNELFGASPALEIVRKHLGGKIDDRLSRKDVSLLREKEVDFFKTRRWVRAREKQRGILSILKIKTPTPFDNRWNEILGRYRLCKNNLGMMPLMVRTMQNNLKSSISEISFCREGEALYLDYLEAGDGYRIRIGIYGYEKNIINLRGESYILWALGEASVDENGDRTFKIELVPSETASVRRLIIIPRKDRIEIEFLETPNDRVAKSFLEQNLKNNSTLAFGVEVVERKLGEGAIADILGKTFNPSIIGVDVSAKDFEAILREENESLSEETEKVRAIKGVIDRFFREEKEPQSIEKIVKKSISDIFDKISGKSRQVGENDN